MAVSVSLSGPHDDFDLLSYHQVGSFTFLPLPQCKIVAILALTSSFVLQSEEAVFLVRFCLLFSLPRMVGCLF